MPAYLTAPLTVTEGFETRRQAAGPVVEGGV